MAVPDIIGVTAIITAILAVTIYAGERTAVSWSPAVIIAIAIVLRLIFLFRPSELSDDIYRYLWDGLQVLSGRNPYSTAPSNFQPQSEILSHLLKRLNHPDFVTIYPPAAQIVFAVGALIGKGVFGIKLLLIVIDIITCFMLIKLLSLLKLPAWRAVLYAWHPLPVIEIAASGHIDGAVLLFFFIAMLFLVKQSEVYNPNIYVNTFSQLFSKPGLLLFIAGFAFSFAFLTKIFPIVFLPALLISMRSRIIISFMSGFLIGSIILILPFLPDLKNMLITLNIYLQNWEFSGVLFRTLRQITSSGNIARLILASVFILTTMFLCGMLWLKRERSPFNTLYHITLAFLLLTPTLHPWYALYLVCLFPFVPGPAGLSLSWSIFLSYRVIIPYFFLGQWIEDEYTPALIWFAPVATHLLIVSTKKLMERRSFH
jgi:hypothetical protein